MTPRPDLTVVASAIGEPARGKMLNALMDGRALTATELALEAGVTPSTASSHLSQLAQAGVVSMARQGRHRYFRIASPEVATLFEALMGLAARSERRPPRGAPDVTGIRRARVCYDHLAGERAVQLLERLRARGFITTSDDAPELRNAGKMWCRAIGIDLDALASRRPLCRPCLDWSERRTHLGGALGASLLDRLFTLRLARREPGSRTVLFSPRGEAFLERLEV